MRLTIRTYRGPEDAAATYAAYRSAILRTAAADYEPYQIAAWAGGDNVDLAQWDARRSAARTFVAVIGEQVVGFADLLVGESGGVHRPPVATNGALLDMLFVHPDFGRRGVARALVERVKQEAGLLGLSVVHTHASRTARPAFEQFGFEVVEARPDNRVAGVVVPNFAMRCALGPTLSPELLR